MNKLMKGKKFAGRSGIGKENKFMKGRIATTLSGVLLFGALAGIMTSCGKKVDPQVERTMIVVFSTGNAKVIRAGKAEEAKVGLIVKEQDQIKTEDGSVDLQTKGGSAIRVREFTTVTVSSLAGGGSNDTKVQMGQGSILANVKKSSANETFNVVTPTAIAGVRGTSFSVEISGEGQPKVKVLEGKVAMSPRVPALESYTKEEIQASPVLSKLASVEKQEVVLEEKTEGTIPREVSDNVAKVSVALETAKKEQKPVAEVKEIQKITETLSVKEKPAVEKKEAIITEQDLREKETLITVAPEVVQKIMEQATEKKATESTTPIAIAPELAEMVKKDRGQKEEVVLKKIEEEASKVKLSSDEEIKNHYNALELIILKNGENIRGAIIAQTGDVMMIHSSTGIRRVKKAEIASQEFAE